MQTIRCPHCGSPATVTAGRWECGWCGDFGAVTRAPARLTLTCTVTPDGPVQGDPSREDAAQMDRLAEAFPEALRHWPEEKRTDAYIQDLLQATYPDQPELAIRMWRMVLDDAGAELQASDMAELLLDEYMETVWKNGFDLPETLEPVLDVLSDLAFAQQLFLSAYMGEPQEAILFACRALHRDAQAEALFALAEPFLPAGTACYENMRRIMGKN